VALLAGCGGEKAAEDAASTVEQEATQAAGDGGAAPAGAITVDLAEWKVEPAEPRAQAGKVVFDARNVGEVPHELEVIATDVPAGDFPVENGRAKVQGEEIGEVTGIGGGQRKTLEVDLDPGHYQLICNIPGHYEPGMYADFEVE
jgi:uncharacterized cupredoxin-like copper-binding protein